MSPTMDAYNNVKALIPVKGESSISFAARCYEIQMAVYSAWAMTDLGVSWNFLPEKIRQLWIESTREQYNKGNLGNQSSA